MTFIGFLRWFFGWDRSRARHETPAEHVVNTGGMASPWSTEGEEDDA